FLLKQHDRRIAAKNVKCAENVTECLPPRRQDAKRYKRLDKFLLCSFAGRKPNLIFIWRYFDESTGMAPGARRVRAGFFSHSRNGALLLDQNVSGAGANLSLAARTLCSPATQQLAASGRQLSGVRRKATHSV